MRVRDAVDLRGHAPLDKRGTALVFPPWPLFDLGAGRILLVLAGRTLDEWSRVRPTQLPSRRSHVFHIKWTPLIYGCYMR